MHGARQQHVFVLVVAHDHQIRLEALDAQGHVGEVTRGVGMLDDLSHLDIDRRQLTGQQLGGARAELGLFMYQHGRLGNAAGSFVDFTQCNDGVFSALAKTGCQAENVFQATADDQVGHANVDQERRVVFGSCLRSGQSDRTGKAAYIG